jgi:DNA-dependent protein kinase catalytic subunit
MRKVKQKLQQISLGYGPVDVSLFSEYLSQLDNNDFYNHDVYVEIPGQYENQNFEPMPSKHVKLACVKEQMLVLASIRRPKRITIHGSNEKDYNLLIKGGEDLRLD